MGKSLNLEWFLFTDVVYIITISYHLPLIETQGKYQLVDSNHFIYCPQNRSLYLTSIMILSLYNRRPVLITVFMSYISHSGHVNSVIYVTWSPSLETYPWCTRWPSLYLVKAQWSLNSSSVGWVDEPKHSPRLKYT